MRKVKKIVSLVLAVTLVLSIVGPFTDALPASAADGDGAADWVTTSEALTVTGDAEKGYNLSTTAQGQAALLKRPVDFKKESVQFRFQPEAGDWAYLYLKPASSDQTVSAFAGGLLDANGQITIMMERVENNLKLSMMVGWNGYEHLFGIIENFKWDENHTIGIYQDEDGNCRLQVDDIVFKDNNTMGGTGDAILWMNEVGKYFYNNGGAYLTFGVHDHMVLPTAIKLVDRNNTPDGWTLGETTAMTGTSEEGWKISFHGPRFEGYGTSYAADIDITKLQAGFNLSELTSGKSIMLQFGNVRGSFDNGTISTVNFMLERKDDGSLVFSGLDVAGMGGLFNYHVLGNFDYTKDHVFTFVQENDKWLPAIDGAVQSGDEATNEVYDTFVKTMNTQFNGKTTVSFAPNDGLGATDKLIIKNIRFTEKEEVRDDDLTGWTPGETTTLTGKPADGWKISFHGPRFEGYGTSYEADIDVSELKVKFNLSELVNDKSIMLQFGNARGNFDNGDETRINFILGKVNDQTLLIHGLDVAGFPDAGGVFNYHVLENFDYNKDHVFEFVKDGDQWLPAIDGEIQKGDAATNEVYDNFVKAMSAQSAGKTMVSFAPNDGLGATDKLIIKNISFIKKATDPTDEDWVKMNGVTVTGDQDQGYTVQGKEYLTAYYRHPLKAADTTISFQMSIADTKWNTLSLAEDMEMPLLPSKEEMKDYKGMAFIFERKGSDLGLQVWEGQNIFELKKYKNFDFDGVHTLTFKNEHGNWYVVFDGEVIRSRQLNEVAGAMLSADQGVYYRFSACYDDYSFGNIKFMGTPQGKWEDSNWNVVGYEMSGRGDDLSFNGNGYASWKQEINLKETSIEIQLEPKDGSWLGFTIGDMPTVGDTIMPGLVVPEAPFNAIGIIMGRQDEKHLRISLYGTTPDGPAEKLIALVRNFDFDAVHKFRLVEKNGYYYLALDGDIMEWPDDDGNDAYITKAITDLIKKLDNKVYFRFMNDQVSGGQWKSISFVKEEFVSPGVFTNGAVTTGVNKNGLSISGAGVVGINSAFHVLKNKLRVQFKPKNESWVLLTIGDTPSTIVNTFWGPDNKHDMMCFVLGRQNNDQLRLSMWDGEKEALLVCLNHFNFDAAHTFGFVQHRGKYYLAIDDRMIEAVAMDGENEIVTSWITKAVKRLSKGTAYVRFACEDTSHMELSKIQWDGVNFRGVGIGVNTGDSFPVVPLAVCVVFSAGGMLISGKRIRKRKVDKI